MKKWILLFLLTVTSVIHASPRTLAVKGHATLSKPADELSINIGILNQGKTALQALNENSAKVKALIDALNKAGLNEKEYQTGRFSIRPLYNQRPKEADQNWTPKVIGFEIENTLRVNTAKVDQAGSIIDQATQVGANTINNINFQLKNPRLYREEAIQAATQNALNDAVSLSQAAGVKLLQIQAVSIDDAQAAPRQAYMMKSMLAEGSQIISGDVTVSATVTLIYAIQ